MMNMDESVVPSLQNASVGENVGDKNDAKNTTSELGTEKTPLLIWPIRTTLEPNSTDSNNANKETLPTELHTEIMMGDDDPRMMFDAKSYVASEFDLPPDLNVYQHKKTLAQGMMDLALFSANANQLRYVLEAPSTHPYFYPSIALISTSLVFQVLVGCGLIWNATYNVRDDVQICIANKINNFTIIGIFLVTVINVFISAFGVATPAVL